MLSLISLCRKRWILRAYTVTIDQFNASLFNRNINFFKEYDITDRKTFEW